MSQLFVTSQFVSQISVEEKQEFENKFQEGGIDETFRYISERTSVWQSIPFNIGVIGSSGVGKSSFINGMRGLSGDDEGAADISVNEATTIPTPYEHPKNQNVKFWDLPGVGTRNYPKATYLADIEFSRYDFFIVLTASRFTETDLWLVTEIQDSKKDLYLVRNKVGVDLDNDKKGHPKTHNANEVVLRIRTNLADNMHHLNLKPRLFLIDSYETEKYDFANLQNYLIEDYPRAKRQALIKSISHFIEGIVRKKIVDLRSRIKYMAFDSAVVTAIPVSFLSIGIDCGILMREVDIYFEKLGLNKTKLIGTASFDGYGNVHPYASAFNQGHLTMEDVYVLTDPISNQKKSIAAFTVAEESVRLIPYYGSFVASPISYIKIRSILNHILDKFEHVSLKIVDAFVDKIIEVP